MSSNELGMPVVQTTGDSESKQAELVAIRVNSLSKCYQIYDNPRDRLKQFVVPRLQRLARKSSKHYFREFWALKDVSFEIKKGESVGIIGRNGSGKSTMLQIICGTLHPSAGDIEVNGRVAALLELGSGFNPEFTGRENVYMNAGVLGLTLQQTKDRFAEIEAFADIGDFIDQPVKTYSSGMMVRLAFAVIAHVDADILVIDEALAVGDAFFTQKCMRFLRHFMKTGTVLFVSHDTGAIKNLCNRAIWIEKGKVLQEGSPKDVCESYLEAFYEAQQGKSSTTKLKILKKHDGVRVQKDQRMAFINASNLRNDLQIFKFDPESASFGDGGAQITAVEFLDSDGSSLSWVVGGELVTLVVQATVNQPLEGPIIGFTVKDRLGQALFGENTYLTNMDNPLSGSIGDEVQAEFTFLMPILPPGDYSVNVAIASGTQVQHIQHHWISDAVMFKSQSSSSSTGLIGIPMHQIKLDVARNLT
ncbi:ABC transporter family protein [Collimonas arenae]|uniref:ABC transporter family protein n=2 Tax=Collimonas arenae TaxID=279058 RepID=A0A127PMN4_9BURK|nr:ABC transporter family protein [Collimonas arenae]AMP08581.1 ABC transporter family protein [Collimonas arenae]